MTDLKLAANDFRDRVWPILAPVICIGGTLRSVELEETTIANEFDREAGIDHYIFSRDRPLVGIAARVQWKNRPGQDASAWYGPPWNSFTQRVLTGRGNDWTELAKRLAAFNGNGLLPQLTVQAYLERPCGDVQSIGLTTCQIFYRYINRCLDAGRVFVPRANPQDGSEFIWVTFREIECFQWYGGRRDWEANDDSDEALRLVP